MAVKRRICALKGRTIRVGAKKNVRQLRELSVRLLNSLRTRLSLLVLHHVWYIFICHFRHKSLSFKRKRLKYRKKFEPDLFPLLWDPTRPISG